ncbi:MAG: hypothetical protein LBL87_02045 [Ruminococcus sp.]|nr:hypothetical protein [Ruminococcus sp.]
MLCAIKTLSETAMLILSDTLSATLSEATTLSETDTLSDTETLSEATTLSEADTLSDKLSETIRSDSAFCAGV